MQEIYLDNLSLLDYVRPNTFTPLRNLKKISMSNNIILKAIDVEAFDKKQQLSEVSSDFIDKNIALHLTL